MFKIIDTKEAGKGAEYDSRKAVVLAECADLQEASEYITRNIDDVTDITIEEWEGYEFIDSYSVEYQDCMGERILRISSVPVP